MTTIDILRHEATRNEHLGIAASQNNKLLAITNDKGKVIVVASRKTIHRYIRHLLRTKVKPRVAQ